MSSTEIPLVGQTLKVHLPGEAPYAECLAVHPDGSWDGRIENKLFHEYSPEEQAQWLGKEWSGNASNLPKLHDFKKHQIVRFALDAEFGIWTPADKQPKSN